MATRLISQKSPELLCHFLELIKLLLIPVVVGISYELIKLAGRSDGILTRIISAPGMWLQHITTCEPDDGQIECAIAALNAVIPEDENADRW